MHNWWQTKQAIHVLTERDSWIHCYTQKLVKSLSSLGYQSQVFTHSDDVIDGDILFILGCTSITPQAVLDKYQRCLVVHESALPHGKGFAPMTWQVLEGSDQIPICLIEAAESVDAGDIYGQGKIQLDGTELCDELRNKQGLATNRLCLDYVQSQNEPQPKAQRGESTYYPRRNPSHSQLDVSLPLQEQFNLLRCCDNERYPAFFEINGVRYQLAISKVQDEP